MTIGDRIRKVREAKGILQTELANATQISKQNLYKYETNIISNIPSDKIETIAEFLDVSPAYLMGWVNNPVPFDDRDTEKVGSLTPHEAEVILSYRSKPELQPAVDKLLLDR